MRAAITIVRRVLSPIVVLLGYYIAYKGLLFLTGDTIDALSKKGTAYFQTATLDQLLMVLVTVLAWACLAWLALGTVLLTLSAIPGAFGTACGAVAEKVTPAAYRRVAKIALGVSIAAGPVFGAMPAQAATTDAPTQSAAAAAQQLPGLDRQGSSEAGLPGLAQLPGLDRQGTVGQISQGLPIPDRPMSAQSADDNRASRAQSQAQHVVQRGDTLWDIAKSRLPDGASGAEINREWHRWYDYNRQVIGEDPNLILPGQVLKAPPSNFR